METSISFTELASTVLLCADTWLDAKWGWRATAGALAELLAEWGTHVSKDESTLCQEERVPQEHMCMCVHMCIVCMCAYACVCRGRRSFPGQGSS